MKSKFKVGDKVKCINSPFRQLTIGEIYTIKQIKNISNETLYVEEIPEYENGFYSHRFELVESAPIVHTLNDLVNKAKDLVDKKVTDSKDGKKFSPDNIKVYLLEKDVKLSSGRAQDSFKRNGFAICLNGGGITIPVEDLDLAPEVVTIKLTKDYDAKIYADRVEVGCQTIPLDKLKELLKLAETLG